VQLLLFHDLVLVVEYELAIVHVHSISKGIVELPLINMTILVRRTFISQSSNKVVSKGWLLVLIGSAHSKVE
jgi:hypothetical protein